MRVKIIGDTESARVLRGYLQKAGVAVSDHLPKFALSCTIHLSEHSGQNIICDSIDCPLEMHILRHITELTEKDVVLRRRTGVISTENEIHLSVPTGDPESAHAVEVGVLRGVQRAHFHRPWWRRVLPTVLLVSLLAPTAWSSPRHATPQPELTSETSGGVIHISMPPGGIFPQFQTGGTITVTINTASPLTGGGTIGSGGVLNLTCPTCVTSSLSNPMTTLGDIIYGASSGTPTRLGANSTATNQFLRSVSSGVPVWAQPTIADVGAGTSSANYSFTGNNTQSNWNAVIIDDGVKYSGCPAAVTAAGTTNKTLLIIPSNGPFVDCGATIPENITLWNFDGTREWCNGDGGAATPPCNAVNFNYDDGNVYAAERHEMTTAHQNSNGVTLGLYTITHLKNATANGTSGIDGMSAEANTEGTLTGTFQALQADEANITIKSTGGTITDVRGGVFYANIPNSGTTAVTNVTGVKALGCNVVNTGSKPTNCIGIEVSDQTSGGVGKASGRNYSLLSRGISLFGYSSGLGAGGFDLEDATNTAKPFLRVDSSSNTILEAINSNGLLLQDSTGANQLKASSSGLQVFKDMLHAETTAPSAASGFDVCYGDSTDHMLECADNNGTFRPLRPLVLFVTSDFTTAANTNLQTITGLSWTVPARANKMNVACSLAYHQNTAAVADNWGIQAATNNPTNIFATYDAQTAATAYAGGVLATLATTTATNIGGTFTPSAITTDWTAKVNALIENAASANTFNVMIKTSVSGDALVVKRGSTCTITFQ